MNNNLSTLGDRSLQVIQFGRVCDLHNKLYICSAKALAAKSSCLASLQRDHLQNEWPRNADSISKNLKQYGEMKKQSAGRRVRREKTRRKKMQVREKVGKSRNTVFFCGFVAPEG